MGKPRVAFFIDEWRPGSGTEIQLQGLISHLAPDDIEAHLFTLHTPLSTVHRKFFPCPVDCLDIGSLTRPAAAVKLPGISARLRRGQFDAAMIYFVDSNLYLVPACRLAGIPAVVINRRDMGYWYGPRLLRMVNFVNRGATHFLVNAQAVKEQVVRHEHFPSDRIHVIPNCMWDSPYRNRLLDAGSSPPPPGFPSPGPVVGITASLRAVKRVDRFLEMSARVVRAVPEAHFVIAGQGRYMDALQEQARVLGLSEKVHFLGQIKDVPALLGHLKVGVLTSESEGLSNSLVEYGLAALPAVAFSVGGNPEVIQEGQTGFLVSPNDTTALADRVIQLLQDEGKQNELGLAAREFCQTNFFPDRVKTMTMDFFSALVDSRGGS